MWYAFKDVKARGESQVREKTETLHCYSRFTKMAVKFEYLDLLKQ